MKLPGVPKRRELMLLAYGFVVAVLVVGTLAAVSPEPLPALGTRTHDLNASLHVLEDGGPILVQRDESPRSSRYGKYERVGYADSEGIYLIVPPLSAALGVRDPRDTLKWLYLALAFVTIASYPLLFRALFDSMAVAVIAPLGVAAGVASLWFTDVYWVPAILVFALLPVVLLVDRRWPHGALAILAACVFAAGIASYVRGFAGVSILVAALLVVIVRRRPVPWRGAAAVALLAAYLAATTLVPAVAHAYRDSQVNEDLPGDRSSHVFWHTNYIGLGYIKNKYGIRYLDQSGDAAAQRENPGVPFASQAYEKTLRKLYFRRVRDDPGYYSEVMAAKTLVLVGHNAIFMVWLALLAPAIFLLERRGGSTRRYMLLAVPAVVFNVLPPILSIPSRIDYETGLRAALGFMCLITVGWLCAGLERVVGPAPWRAPGDAVGALRERLPELRSDPRFRRTAVMSAAAILVTLVLFVLSRPVERDSMRWQASAPATPSASGP